MFWNTSGIESVEEKTWKNLKEAEIIGSTGTWVEKEKGEEKIKGKLKGFECFFITARREKKKGRAKGGILLAVKTCKEIRICSRPKVVNEECMTVEVEIKGEKWTVGVIYMRKKGKFVGKPKERIRRKAGRKDIIRWIF